jgi:pimeloyl-ACP methyl ester carboxylesterase
LFVPGVFGDGANYNGLRRAVADGGSAVRTVTWGVPKPLFVANFSDAKIHDEAESKLAKVIDETQGEVNLVGHSAGCGVILGALAKAHRDVGHVVLIAPSVSPGYDVAPALTRSNVVHYLSSDRDTVFLKWRCGTFGTYDRVKTPAAGYAGFQTLSPKLIQHPYDPAWDALGNHGGHSDAIGEKFVAAVVAPLLTGR